MGFKQRLDGQTGVETCSCGKHRGKGTSSPYQLAQIYAWFKDFRPDDCDMTKEKWEYLETYEQSHGRIFDYIYGKERPDTIAVAEPYNSELVKKRYWIDE